jgi:hypothetical protein
MTTLIYSPYLIFPFLLMCYAAAAEDSGNEELKREKKME